MNKKLIIFINILELIPMLLLFNLIIKFNNSLKIKFGKSPMLPNCFKQWDSNMNNQFLTYEVGL